MSSTKRPNNLRRLVARGLGFCAVITVFYTAAVVAEDNYVVAGSAYNLDNNQLVYRELYTALDENKAVRVDYVKPEGNVFATKTLVYQGEPFQPSLNFEDKRDSHYLAAQFQGARLVLIQGTKDARNEKVIFDNARLVIDSGFDAYIQLNWDKLVAGNRLKFDFAFPERLRTAQLEVRKIKGSESPVYEATYGRDWIYFRITPAKKVASFFSDPINLAYDPNGKYLMRFQGRSIIDDDRGGPQDVRVEYEYVN
jgi:hypothetical protein